MISYTVFSHEMETLSYVWKIYHKNRWHLCLVAHIFTKLSQNLYLINTHILIYQHDRCDCKLWSVPFSLDFWLFSYIIDDHSCLKVVSPPNLHGLCVWSMYTFWYINMPDVTTSYERISGLIRFFEHFNASYVILHQTFVNFEENSWKWK